MGLLGCFVAAIVLFSRLLSLNAVTVFKLRIARRKRQLHPTIRFGALHKHQGLLEKSLERRLFRGFTWTVACLQTELGAHSSTRLLRDSLSTTVPRTDKPNRGVNCWCVDSIRSLGFRFRWIAMLAFFLRIARENARWDHTCRSRKYLSTNASSL